MTTDPGTSFTLFTWKDIAVYHGEGVLKVGTDAILLGTFVPKVISEATTIMDAGCGSGILAVMAGSAFPTAHIVALDSSEEAIAMTQKNVFHNRMQDRIVCRQADILVSGDRPEKVDLIISNPPYYRDQWLPSQETMLRAKHSEASPDQWMRGMSLYCDAAGKIAIIVPYGLAADWIRAGNDIGWYCQHRMNVYDCSKDDQPKRSMLVLSRTLQQPIVKTMVMHNDARHLTDSYLAWIK